MEVKGFDSDCRSCEEFAGVVSIKDDVDAYIMHGSVRVGIEDVWWVIKEMDEEHSAAEKHYIFTTISHHCGAEEVEMRAILNAEATRIAAKFFGTDYRLVNNSGEASTRYHYHLHIIVPADSDRLPKVVVNTQKIINAPQVPQEVRGFLEEKLLQKPKRIAA